MSTLNLCFEHKYEKISDFFIWKVSCFGVKFSFYLNRRVFVMQAFISDKANGQVTSFLVYVFKWIDNVWTKIVPLWHNFQREKTLQAGPWPHPPPKFSYIERISPQSRFLFLNSDDAQWSKMVIIPYAKKKSSRTAYASVQSDQDLLYFWSTRLNLHEWSPLNSNILI